MPHTEQGETLDRATIDADYRIGEVTNLICDMDRLGMSTAGAKRTLQVLINNQAGRDRASL